MSTPIVSMTMALIAAALVDLAAAVLLVSALRAACMAFEPAGQHDDALSGDLPASDDRAKVGGHPREQGIPPEGSS